MNQFEAGGGGGGGEAGGGDFNRCQARENVQPAPSAGKRVCTLLLLCVASPLYSLSLTYLQL